MLDGHKRTNDIAKALNLGVPALPRHLRHLRQTGLVARYDDEADGRARLYGLEISALATDGRAGV